MARVIATLTGSGIVDSKNLVSTIRPVTRSEDAHMLVSDPEEVKIAYLPIGTAQPGIFAQAKAEEKPVPFSNHQPHYEVDPNAILYGSTIAGIIVMDLMANDRSS